MISLAHINRSYIPGDRRSVVRLLADLDRKYPGGLSWLDKRLNDVDLGRAYADLLIVRSRIAAVSIVTPKGRRRSKLSTFFVCPAYRKHGLGTRLIKVLEYRWQSEDLEEVIVTVNRNDPDTAGFFSNHHFSKMASAVVSYGEGRWDHVMRWTPDAACSTTFS